MTTPDIRLVPKTDDETARWLPVAMAAYEQARRDAGDGPEQAEAARRLSQEQFFPDGRLIDGHFLFTVVDGDGDDVGWLWIGPVDGASAWYVWVPEVFQARVAETVTDLIDRFAGKRVVAVCHGGVINVVIGSVLGVKQPLWFEPGYTSVSRMIASRTGIRSVASVNELAHLQATRERL